MASTRSKSFVLLGGGAGLLTIAGLMSPMPALAVLPALALPVLLLMWRRPHIALYAVVFMIPFGAWRKIGDTIDLPWLLAAFLLGVLVVDAAFRRRLPTVPPTLFWHVFVLYVAVCLVSAGMSADRALAIKTTLLTVASGVFILLVQLFLTPHGVRHTLHRVVIWSVSVGSFLGLQGLVFGVNVFGEDRPDGVDFRAVGGAIDPNNQAIMVVFAFPLIIHQMIHAESRRERRVMAGLAVLNTLGVLSTVSRSGFVMFLLVCIALLFHYRRLVFTRRRFAPMFLAFSTVIAVSLPLVPTSFVERQLSLLEWEDRSLSRRGTYLEVARAAIVENPLLGSGPGTFRLIYGRSDQARLFTSQAERLDRKAHNTYLEVLVGSGLFGLALFLTMIGMSLRHLRQAQQELDRAGKTTEADLLACWQIGYTILLLFLLMLSDMHHKFMLLSIGLSQACVLYYRTVPMPSAPPIRPGLGSSRGRPLAPPRRGSREEKP